MLFLAVVAVALLTVRAAGGKFTLLSELRLRASVIVAFALIAQVLLISVWRKPPAALAGSLHLTSYAVAAGFLAANRRTRGMLVVGCGGALNAVAIVANGGRMPATTAALRTAGIARSGEHFANSAVVAGARLPWLGDVFAVPQRAGLLANVFSVGDVVLCVGVVVLIHHAAGCRWARGLDRGGRVGAEHGDADVDEPVDAHHLEFVERRPRVSAEQ